MLIIKYVNIHAYSTYSKTKINPLLLASKNICSITRVVVHQYSEEMTHDPFQLIHQSQTAHRKCFPRGSMVPVYKTVNTDFLSF